jgi:hypothetical protein
VSSQTRLVLIFLIGVGWCALGLVNLAKDRVGIGVLYVGIGVVCLGMALAVSRGRRSR